MISSVYSSKYCFLSAALVGFLWFLIILSEFGVVVCNYIRSEEHPFIFPPQSSESPYPRLLHERDVIRYQDANGQFVSIGSGTYADVTLGELKSSGIHVVVKSFKNSPFRDILKEIRLHRYVEQLGITPILIGLLPSGPLAGNISLVYEYIHFSKPLDDWLDNYKELSTVQWLHICHQIALALLRLHQNDVLFNDLHRGNVLIQKRGDNIRVYLIDFGFATYKSGRLYTSSYGNFSGYNFIAPEVVNRFPSTQSTDVFALGYTFRKMADKIKLTPLFHLANWCMAPEPASRPSLLTIISKLDSVLFGVSLEQFKQKQNINICSKDINVQLHNDGLLILTKEKLAAVSERYLLCPALITQMSSMTASNFDQENSNDWAWLTQNKPVLFERCRVPLFVLDEHDLTRQSEEAIHWLSRAANDAIRLAELKLTNETVVVKEFFEVQFEKIREETCRTGFLGEINVAPKIIGVLIEYKRMEDIAFVQELFGNGVGLTEFLSLSSGHDWDLDVLKKIAKGETKLVSQDSYLPVLFDSCEYNASRLFHDLLRDISNRLCQATSHRRMIMEGISTLLIKKMISIHESGYLVNNLHTNNILVKWNDSKDNSFDIDIRLIDLGLTSSIYQGSSLEIDLNYLSQLSYLAPEVVRGHKTSRSSDTYSLCFALNRIMQDYFPSPFTPFSSDSHFNAGGPYSKSSSCHLDQCERSNIAVLRYQHLLSKCLHGSHRERPQLKDLLTASSLVP